MLSGWNTVALGKFMANSRDLVLRHLIVDVPKSRDLPLALTYVLVGKRSRRECPVCFISNHSHQALWQPNRSNGVNLV